MSAILYLGPEGTHSHEAAMRRFGGLTGLEPCRSLKEVFAELVRRSDTQAVVPAENSIEGPVTQTLDLLANTPDVRAQTAFGMRIRHHLLAGRETRAREEVRRVYSHPQALGQCADWLARNLPRADTIPTASTAEAARLVASAPGAVAVAGDFAARLYGLTTLAADIQDAADNITRFFVLATDDANRGQTRTGVPVRTLLHLILPDKPGALLRALEPFHDAELNLTSIQSRPLRGRPWEYGFFMEVAGDVTDPRYAAMLARIRAHAEICRFLGVYPNEAPPTNDGSRGPNERPNESP